MGVADGIILDDVGRQRADQFLVFKLVEREAVAGAGNVVILRHEGNDARCHLQLYVGGGGDLLVVLIERLEVMAYNVALGNNVGTEIEVEHRDDSRRNEVGAQQPLEAHAAGQHGNDFGIACQLGGEEDDGDEDEERREEVGEIRHEVDVIVHNDGPQGRMVGSELRQILVDVEDNGDGDNQGNGIDIGADELPDDV